MLVRYSSAVVSTETRVKATRAPSGEMRGSATHWKRRMSSSRMRRLPAGAGALDDGECEKATASADARALATIRRKARKIRGRVEGMGVSGDGASAVEGPAV